VSAEAFISNARRSICQENARNRRLTPEGDIKRVGKLKADWSFGRTGWWVLACISVPAAIALAVFVPNRPVRTLRDVAPQSQAPRRATAEAEQTAVPAAAPEPGPALESPDAPPLSVQSDSPLRYSGVGITGGEDPHAYAPRVELCRNGSQWTGFIALYT